MLDVQMKWNISYVNTIYYEQTTAKNNHVLKTDDTKNIYYIIVKTVRNLM